MKCTYANKSPTLMQPNLVIYTNRFRYKCEHKGENKQTARRGLVMNAGLFIMPRDHTFHYSLRKMKGRNWSKKAGGSWTNDSNYGCLFLALRAFGVNANTSNRKPWQKLLHNPFAVVFHVVLLYLITISMFHTFAVKRRAKELSMLHALIGFVVMILWRFLVSPASNAVKLLREMNSSLYRRKLFINSCLVIFASINICFQTCSVVSAHLWDKQSVATSFFLFGAGIGDMSVELSVPIMIVGTSSCVTVGIVFPFIVALVIYVLCSNLNRSLSEFNKELERCRVATLKQAVTEYKKIEDIAHKIENAVSLPSLMLMVLTFSYIFYGIFLFVKLSDLSADVSIVGFTLLAVCNSISMAAGVILCSSRVTLLSKVSILLFNNIYESLVLAENLELEGNQLKSLKLIINKKPICLTAANFFTFKKGLILTWMGAMFTYGLLAASI